MFVNLGYKFTFEYVKSCARHGFREIIMKQFFKLLIFVVLMSVLAMSCSTTYSYYQVGEIRPVDDNVKIDINSKLIYFDDNIFIEYSFWSSYGNVSFVIKNLTDTDITIHLDKSFFIRNGMAYDYFQDKAYMTVPAKAFKVINQFNVTDFMYRSCDLYLWKSILSEQEAKKRSFRSNGEILNKLIFNTENTPLLFENRLVYSLEHSDDEIEVVNKFYVKSIQNMYEDEFEYYVVEKNCGEEKKVMYKAQFAPNRYYIKYDERSFDSNF